FFIHVCPTHLSPLSLHDALPIFPVLVRKYACSHRSFPLAAASVLASRASSARTRVISSPWAVSSADDAPRASSSARTWTSPFSRSEEHTSELQSRVDLVCRLLLV